MAQEGKLKKLDSSLLSVDPFSHPVLDGHVAKTNLYGLLEEINSLGQLHFHLGP